MIKYIPILLILLSCFTLTAQEYKGKLIDNDGISKEHYLLDPYKKSNYNFIYYLHYGHPTEAYATNYKRAVFSNDHVYTSIKVEESIGKVWARLHFESDLIKLYLRYNKYYVEINNRIFDISKSQNLESLQLPDQLKKQWKQALKNSEPLPFKKVKTFLTEYHKQENIEHKSYFNKQRYSIKIDVKVEIEGGLALTTSKANITKSEGEQFDVNLISPRAFANCRLYFPKIVKNAFVSVGISMQKFSVNQDLHKRFDNNDNYYETEVEFLQIAVPFSFNMKIASWHNFNIYAKAGAKKYFNSGDKGSLNSEYKTDQVVRSEQNELQLANKDGLAPIIGILIDKKFGKQQVSLSLNYEHYNESGDNSPKIPQIELNSSAISIGLAMKF